MAAVEWFSAQELADLRLPGLPTSKRRVNVFADTMGWRDYGPSLVRPRAKRGGGLEYHISILPYEAQQALLCRALNLPKWAGAEAEERERLIINAERSKRLPARVLGWAIDLLCRAHDSYVKGGRS